MAAVAELPRQAHFADSVLELPLSLLVPAEDNPRSDLGDLTDLAATIKSVGLLQPIVATPRVAAGAETTYTVVAGHRRLAAAALAGLEYVPVYVKEMTDAERVAAMLVENLEREDLSPVEEAGAYRRLVEEFGMSQRQLSTKVSRSQSHISKRLTLLQLPVDLLADIDSGGITIDDAVELAKLKDDDAIRRVLLRYNPHYPETLRNQIDQEAFRMKQAAAVRAREEQLESKAIATLRVESRWNLPKGVHKLKGKHPGYEPHALQISEADHAKFQCHRIALCANGPTVEEFPVCIDRKQHPAIKTEQQTEKRVPKSRANEQKARDELREIAKTRKTFIAGLVAGKLNKTESIDQIMLALIERVEQMEDESLDFVLVALGLATVKEPGIIVGRTRGQLRSYALEGPTQMLRAALACALAENEEYGFSEWNHTWTEADASQLAYLERHGYDVTPVERKHLPKIKAAKASKAAA